MNITYGSVCSGIEAASVAWEPLGFRPSWFSEIEDFPSAVLAHHWPQVPNLGDMTKISDRILSGEIEAPDILVGGTPCQAFSVAGARKGLSDERGQLTISYGELADAIDKTRTAAGKQPAIIVWENVPGVLSSKDNAFGAFLGLLSGEDCELEPPGGKWTNAGYVSGPKRAIAWRVLDAQYFGVAQRRRRVFVVASARAGFNPAEVLFEREGVRRDTPPSREEGAGVAALTANGVGTCAADREHVLTSGQESLTPWEQQGRRIQGSNGVAPTLMCNPAGGMKLEPVLVSEPTPINLQVITRHESLGRGTGFGLGLPGEAAYTLGAAHMHGVWSGPAVRRLMPIECERLQGFPEHKINVTISVSNDRKDDVLCSDHQKKSVRAGTKNPKLLRYAPSVDGDELPSDVKFVGLSSKRNPEKPSEHVAAHVLIDLELMHLQILSAGKSILSVSIADEQNQSPLPIPSGDFARVAALMMQQAVKITATGKAELAASETCSSHQENGRLRSSMYGQEISELARDAELFTNLVREHLKSITSQAGRNSLNSEQMFAISSCFVAAAISGFIPEQMRKGNSFALNVTVSHSHTQVPYRGKPAADGPRYKAIGNSMAVPCMAWIGRRIAKQLSPDA